MKLHQSLAFSRMALRKVLKSSHMSTMGKIIPVHHEEGK